MIKHTHIKTRKKKDSKIKIKIKTFFSKFPKKKKREDTKKTSSI